MFNINTRSEKPIYEQIMENIKELILKNILREDDKLPSVRQLATNLSVNPNTVSRAYQELERQKIIYSQRGRGTFISGQSKTIDDERLVKVLEDLRSVCIELGHLGYDKEKILEEIETIYAGREEGESDRS